MLIEHRGIIAERTEDVPDHEWGALVIAKDCHMNCAGCFNQHLKQSKVIKQAAEEIVDIICSNPLHDWLVLGGLEWTENIPGMLALVDAAQQRNLKVIIYTGCTPKQFAARLDTSLPRLKGCYVKYGSYDETRKAPDLQSYNVRMASMNQFITIL